MEIGVGKGRFLLNAAAANRDRDYFGLEIEAEYAAIARLRAERAGLTNVRVERLDGKAFVLRRLAPGAVAALHVYFPDPWPKKRHHKRRLLQPAFVHELALRLQPGGYLHVATDWRDYAGSILAALSAERLLRNTARDYAKRPAYRPVTKFERRGVGLGHEVWDLIFRKR
jgi:tRNA (guanine-N7-)-methyltransferase